jgi:hypothetical protein
VTYAIEELFAGSIVVKWLSLCEQNKRALWTEEDRFREECNNVRKTREKRALQERRLACLKNRKQTVTFIRLQEVLLGWGIS